MLELAELIREKNYPLLTLAVFPSLYIYRQKAKNKDISIWKFFPPAPLACKFLKIMMMSD